jgi:hypothetical protein
MVEMLEGAAQSVFSKPRLWWQIFRPQDFIGK